MRLKTECVGLVKLVDYLDHIYISVRGGGAGGAAAPPVGKKIVLFGQKWCTVRAKKQ